MPGELSIRASSYVEQIATALIAAKPYFQVSPSGQSWDLRQRNSFPRQPGIYLILRRVASAGEGYRYHGLIPVNPIVLYVGRTTERRKIEKRLADNFGNSEPNFQGSQFVKFLMQVIQDEPIVKSILWSPQTLIASVPITEGEQMLETVERLAMQVFVPRFNIRDR
jgi:hypothetical protein